MGIAPKITTAKKSIRLQLYDIHDFRYFNDVQIAVRNEK
jgi:hypothetical protein